MSILSISARCHCICIALGVLLAATGHALATDVGVVGLFPGKAVLVVNGGKPRTLAVGEKTGEGVRLMAVEVAAVLLEIDGKRRTVSLGGQAFVGGGEGPAATYFTADARGHFFTLGSVNGINSMEMRRDGDTLTLRKRY